MNKKIIINSGFIKDEKLIEEDYRTKDQFDFSNEAVQIENKIKNVSNNAIIGIVGKYGSGKSVTINKVEEKTKNDYHCIHFDAWKYPERNDLWEGFIFDFADQIGKKKNFLKKIEGKNIKNKIVEIIAPFTGLFVIPITILNNFLNIFSKSGATKVFQLLDILSDLIKTQRKQIIFVIEDIDRSESEGKRFLETLNNFIKNTKNINNKIIVLSPISEYSFSQDPEAYFKSIDYFIFFKPKNHDLNNFVLNIFKTKYLEIDKKSIEQLVSFFIYLLNEEKISIRVLIHIISMANLTHKQQKKDGYNPDFRINICIEASKYTQESQTINFDKFTKDMRIQHQTYFGKLIIGIINSIGNIYDVKEGVSSLFDIEIGGKNKEDYGFNKNLFDLGKSKYFISDYYIKY